MTTIVLAGGIMAADRKAYLGKGEASYARKTKIHRVKGGWCVGVSSSVVGASTMLLQWANDGFDPKAIEGDTMLPEDFDILAAHPNGRVLIYRNTFYPTELFAPFHAVGSGSNYALGALFVGCTAAKAIEVASQFDAYTGGGVDELEIAGG